MGANDNQEYEAEGEVLPIIIIGRNPNDQNNLCYVINFEAIGLDATPPKMLGIIVSDLVSSLATAYAHLSKSSTSIAEWRKTILEEMYREEELKKTNPSRGRPFVAALKGKTIN